MTYVYESRQYAWEHRVCEKRTSQCFHLTNGKTFLEVLGWKDHMKSFPYTILTSWTWNRCINPYWGNQQPPKFVGWGKSWGDPSTIGYSHEDDYESVNLFGRSRAPAYSATPAYTSQQPISVAKYNDLQKLCTKGIIPIELYGWYAALPTSVSVVDTTTEPAVEDTDEELN